MQGQARDLLAGSQPSAVAAACRHLPDGTINSGRSKAHFCDGWPDVEFLAYGCIIIVLRISSGRRCQRRQDSAYTSHNAPRVAQHAHRLSVASPTISYRTTDMWYIPNPQISRVITSVLLPGLRASMALRVSTDIVPKRLCIVSGQTVSMNDVHLFTT